MGRRSAWVGSFVFCFILVKGGGGGWVTIPGVEAGERAPLVGGGGGGEPGVSVEMRGSEGEALPASTGRLGGVDVAGWGRAIYLCGGILVCLIGYGILQERLMSTPFPTVREDGSAGEMYRFTNSLFLVFCNRAFAVVFAVGAMLVGGPEERRGLTMVAPWYSYAVVSLSNVVATTCQYEALKWVSFPVQTLGKCAKPVPVMAWGLILNTGRKYKGRDYVNAGLVMAGCLLFFIGGAAGTKSAAASGKDDKETTLMGLALMLGYLGFDGFTSTWQEKLFKGFDITEYNQMLYVGIFSGLFTTVALVTSPADAQAMPPGVTVVPGLWWSILMLSACSTIGATFILATIREFGALIFSLVMTTRQLVSIVCSALLFGHALTIAQVTGAGIVFGSLFHKSYASEAEKRAHKAREAGSSKV